MGKKLILTIISGLILSCLTGCVEKREYKDSEPQVVQQNNRFKVTGEYYYIGEDKFSIVMDTKTKNLYLYNSARSYATYYIPSLTPLYDENGDIAKGN